MNEERDKNSFNFTYSASNRKSTYEEVERIRRQYVEKNLEMDGLEKLRSLDKKAKTPATVTSLILGIGGALVFGAGLSMVLAYEWMIAGSFIGIIGMLIMLGAYPSYQYFWKKGKEKYAAEIVQISSKLLDDFTFH